MAQKASLKFLIKFKGLSFLFDVDSKIIIIKLITHCILIFSDLANIKYVISLPNTRCSSVLWVHWTIIGISFTS